MARKHHKPEEIVGKLRQVESIEHSSLRVVHAVAKLTRLRQSVLNFPRFGGRVQGLVGCGSICIFSSWGMGERYSIEPMDGRTLGGARHREERARRYQHHLGRRHRGGVPGRDHADRRQLCVIRRPHRLTYAVRGTANPPCVSQPCRAYREAGVRQTHL